MGVECAQAADAAPLTVVTGLGLTAETGLCSMTCEGPTNTSAGLVQQTGHIHLSFDSLAGQFEEEACAKSCQFISENVCAPNAGVLTCLGIGFPVIPAPAPEPAPEPCTDYIERSGVEGAAQTIGGAGCGTST